MTRLISFQWLCEMILDRVQSHWKDINFVIFVNIIIGIHEDNIPSYNASGMTFLEDQKIKLDKEKEEDHKAAKLAGCWFKQGVCWEKLVNKLPMHVRHAQEVTLRTSILCHTRVFCTYIVWFQLTHLHGRWSHLWHICSNFSPFRDMIVQI